MSTDVDRKAALWQGLKTELAGNALTKDWLGTVADGQDRIFPMIIPQQQRGGPKRVPCVVFQVTSVERPVNYCGTQRLIRTRLSLDSYSTDFEEAQRLAAAVREVLTDFTGMLGGLVDVRMATIETEIDLQDIDPGLYRVNQSWAIWHVE